MRYIIYGSLKENPDKLYRIDEYSNLSMAIKKARELQKAKEDVVYLLVDNLFKETISY